MRKFWQSFAVMLVVSSLFLLVTQSQDDVSNALLDAINGARQQEGLPELVANPLLQQAAQRHSDDMAATETLSHMGSDGSQFWERIQDTGYILVSGAENVLSRGDTDAQAAFQQWYDSTPHRTNILNPRYTEAGIAYTQSSSGTYYFTLVLAVSTQPPATQTPLPTATVTASPTQILPSATPTLRPTDIVAATIIAPLPTNTAAPIMPTNTPIPASLSTSTPSPTPLPPDIRLTYDENSFTLLNVSGQPLNLANLVFESEAGSMTAMRWNTEFLTQSLSGFTDGDCLQAWTPEITELPPPLDCRIRHAWIMVSGDAIFWNDAETFVVRNGTERVGVCSVAAGVCEINLTVPVQYDLTPIPTDDASEMVGQQLPDLHLLYDVQSFSLVNVSGEALDLRGIVFNSEAGSLPIEQWETEFLSQPLNDFSAGDCLQAWTFSYDLLPKPEECRFRHAWVAIPQSSAFWQDVQTFAVERNGIVIGRCVVAQERCEVSLSSNFGAINSQSEPIIDTVAGSADIRLFISENSITLQNTSSGNVDVSNLSFRSSVGTFAAVRWETDALSRPLTELPRADCLQVWPLGIEWQAPPVACEIRHAWVAARPDEVFWQGINTFEVLQSGVSVGQCETRTDTCDIDLP